MKRRMFETRYRKFERGADIYCRNCAFFYDGGPECRRHAPQPIAAMQWTLTNSQLEKLGVEPAEADTDTNYVWPRVDPKDWCGDFQASHEPVDTPSPSVTKDERERPL